MQCSRSVTWLGLWLINITMELLSLYRDGYLVTQTAYKAWRINDGRPMHFNMLTLGGDTGDPKMTMVGMSHDG